MSWSAGPSLAIPGIHIADEPLVFWVIWWRNGSHAARCGRKLQFKMDALSTELCMYKTRNLKGMSITRENSLSENLYEYWRFPVKYTFLVIVDVCFLPRIVDAEVTHAC